MIGGLSVLSDEGDTIISIYNDSIIKRSLISDHPT